jgi:hypothetical protein
MLDPFTSAPTCICGGALPNAADGNRLHDDHRRRLEALDRLRAFAAECGVATDPDRDLVTLPEDTVGLLELGDPVWARLGLAIRSFRALVPIKTLEDFGFPAEAENPIEEPNSRLRRVGGGVEAWVFQGEADGSIYKFYRPIEGTDKRIGSAFDFLLDDERCCRAEARWGTYRELFEKLLLIGALEGMPTEVIAATPEGVVIAKQVLGKLLEQGEDVSGRLPFELIEIPSLFLRADRDHPRLFFCGSPLVVADLHARNLVRAVDGSLRVIDLVAGSWPTGAFANEPRIADWLERVGHDPKASLLPPAHDDDL